MLLDRGSSVPVRLSVHRPLSATSASLWTRLFVHLYLCFVLLLSPRPTQSAEGGRGMISQALMPDAGP